MKNMKTTALGTLGNVLITTVLASLASPEVMASLQGLGINPLYLAVGGGIVKNFRDYFAKDAESAVTTPPVE